MTLYWMSFTDGSRPKGQQFSGVALVEADSALEATRTAWRTGCNPGGQIMFLEIPPEKLDELDGASRNTLMDRATLETFWECQRWEPTE